MTPLVALSAASALAAVVLTAPSANAAEAEDAAYAVDASGKTMRVAFDPGRRVALGAGWAFAAEGQKSVDAAQVSLTGGLTYRHRVEFLDEDILWKLTHEVGRASFTAGARASVVGEAYSLHFLRWSKDGSVVFPTTPPRRLGFPLGLGFEVGAGSVDLVRDGTLRGEVGVARGALLFDFVRSPAHGAYLTLGAGPRYAIRVAEGRAVDHVVVPFSEPELEGRLELGHGHHVLSANAGGGYAWSTRGGGAQARAGASYELVVAAVNDAPLSLRAETTLRYDDPPLPGRAPVELRGGASAVLGFSLPGERHPNAGLRD